MFSGLVCVAPLKHGGIRGKKSTPSIGWEVSVKSHQSTSRSCMEHAGQRLGAGDLGYSTHVFILHGRLLLTLRFHLCNFNCVKKVLT
jgi:hypothetical protein